MKVYINYDGNAACRVILQEQLERLEIQYQLFDLGEIEISDETSEETFEELQNALNKYSIYILNSQKSQLIQRIKDAIVEMIFEKDKMPITTISHYLSDKLNLSYGYLSNVFSEYTYTSIENFIIIQKIEKAKKLIIEEELTLTEISFKHSNPFLNGIFKSRNKMCGNFMSGSCRYSIKSFPSLNMVNLLFIFSSFIASLKKARSSSSSSAMRICIGS